MTGSVDHVLYAAIVFIGIHVLSSTSLRGVLVGRIGETAWQGAFSLLSLAAFLWLILAYGAAPVEPVWSPPPVFRWVPFVLLPFAFILLVASLTTRNPAMAGMDKALDDARPAVGMMTITRHPLFWAFALWGISHLLVNGDLASIWFIGGLTFLSLVRMPLQDHKKMQLKGASWGPYAMRTSALPFLAAIQGRTAIDWRGIGWWRPALGLALYAVVLGGHTTFFGVNPFPLSLAG